MNRTKKSAHWDTIKLIFVAGFFIWWCGWMIVSNHRRSKQELMKHEIQTGVQAAVPGEISPSDQKILESVAIEASK